MVHTDGRTHLITKFSSVQCGRWLRGRLALPLAVDASPCTVLISPGSVPSFFQDVTEISGFFVAHCCAAT